MSDIDCCFDLARMAELTARLIERCAWHEASARESVYSLRSFERRGRRLGEIPTTT